MQILLISSLAQDVLKAKRRVIHKKPAYGQKKKTGDRTDHSQKVTTRGFSYPLSRQNLIILLYS